eukprot:627117-Pleurochrysis_carterae.AAC.1
MSVIIQSSRISLSTSLLKHAQGTVRKDGTNIKTAAAWFNNELGSSYAMLIFLNDKHIGAYLQGVSSKLFVSHTLPYARDAMVWLQHQGAARSQQRSRSAAAAHGVPTDRTDRRGITPLSSLTI